MTRSSIVLSARKKYRVSMCRRQPSVMRTYTCSRCDAKRTESIPMTAHTPETVPGKAATCTEEGVTEGSKCSVCGIVLKKQETIPAAHTPGTAVKENETAATCTAEGSYDEVVYCSVCQEEILRKQVTVEKTAHTWVENAGEGYLVSAATCTAQAVYYKSCSACGAKSEETFAYGGFGAHTSETVPGKDATCFAPGLTEGSKCSVCGEVLQEQQKIEAYI